MNWISTISVLASRQSLLLFTVLAGLALSTSATATYNASAIGNVRMVQQMSTSLNYMPETTTFTTTGQPTVPGAQYQRFVISPATVTDAQTRKNLVALLLTAKALDREVTVAYDSTGGFMDQGMVGVYYVSMQ